MEQILLGLVGSSPAAAATLIAVFMFLRYLREERTAWRDIIAVSLQNNTDAMKAQTLAMHQQAEMLKALNTALVAHDTMAQAAISRLEAK